VKHPTWKREREEKATIFSYNITPRPGAEEEKREWAENAVKNNGVGRSEGEKREREKFIICSFEGKEKKRPVRPLSY